MCLLCVHTEFNGLLVALISGNVGLSDPSELFSKLVELGIIKGEEGKREREREREGSQEKVGGAVQPLPPPEVVGAPIPLAIPTLTFTVATLKK